jgi:hypothetical protein
MLQRVFGHAGPDRHDHNDVGDTVDGPTADPAQPAEQRDADEQTAGQPTADDQRRELAASEEPADRDPAAEAPADDEPAAGQHADEPASRDEPTDLKPSDGPVTLVAAIWAEGSARDLRDRWREAQLRFVDDPRQAATDTRNLVNEAVDTLTAALASYREQLNSLPTNGDTEQYRVVVQRCRTFFERLLTL